MRKYTWSAGILGSIVLVLLLAAPLAGAEHDAPAPKDAYLSDEERQETLALLEGSQSAMLDRIQGLSDQAFNYKPSPDRWSIAEILDHIVVVEKVAADAVDLTMAAPIDPQWTTTTAGQTDRIFRVLPIRVRRFQAPESVQPQGGRSRQELVESYESLRAGLLDLVRDAARPIKAHTSEHPALGQLHVQQWVLFAALHNLRHNQQIVEVMADPGFPH